MTDARSSHIVHRRDYAIAPAARPRLEWTSVTEHLAARRRPIRQSAGRALVVTLTAAVAAMLMGSIPAAAAPSAAGRPKTPVPATKLGTSTAHRESLHRDPTRRRGRRRGNPSDRGSRRALPQRRHRHRDRAGHR